jgi:ribonuclease P protein component
LTDTAPTKAGQYQRLFSRDTRLRSRAAFRFVRESGATAVGRYCVVRAVDAPDGTRRVGFVISRRYSGKAVVRNRARRLFRDAYRELLPELATCWLEFRPRARMRGIKLRALVGEARILLGRLGVLRPPAAE